MDQQNPQPQNIPPELRQFLESIFEEANMTAVDEQMKEDMTQELFLQLDNYLSSVIVDNLLPEDLEIFIKMNEEKKSKEEIEGFIREKLPDAESIFTNAFFEFKRLYLENVKNVQDQNPPDDSQG